MPKILRLSFLLIGALLLAGCGSQSATLSDFFPPADAIPGWTLAEEVRLYNRDNLFDMVDGQADGFFVYGFEQVATQRYQNADGTILEVAIWQLATPADAYGLFTYGLAGQPASVCPAGDVAGPTPAASTGRCYEGDADPGWRLAFWQDRYEVQVYGRRQVPDAALQAFAGAVSALLPQGGDRPELVGALPQQGLVERGFIFFHQEISIQSEIWLGGENILGLSDQTNALLARYDLSGATARLLLIEYPNSQAASAGLAALEASQVEGLQVAGARDNLLGAVFGEVDSTAADALLAQALTYE
jgi:hypothetical protein